MNEERTYKIELTEEECTRLENLIGNKIQEHEEYIKYSDKRKISTSVLLAQKYTMHKAILKKLAKA